MRRELSTRYTFLYRWVIPGALTVAAVAAIVYFARVGEPDSSGTVAVLAGVAIAVGLMALARWFDGAKRVWIEGDELVVAAYGKATPVALQDVDSISQSGVIWPIRVTVKFRHATAWGRKIVFFPPLQASGPEKLHPTVAGLRRATQAGEVSTD